MIAAAPGLLLVEARGVAIAVLAPEHALPHAIEDLRALPEPASRRAADVVVVTMTQGDVVVCRALDPLDAAVLLARVGRVAEGQTALVVAHERAAQTSGEGSRT